MNTTALEEFCTGGGRGRGGGERGRKKEVRRGGRGGAQQDQDMKIWDEDIIESLGGHLTDSQREGGPEASTFLSIQWDSISLVPLCTSRQAGRRTS